jgi:hypothetical protein
MPRCLDKTLTGKRCKMTIRFPGYCHFHGKSVCVQRRSTPVFNLPRCPANGGCVVKGKKPGLPICSKSS